MSSSVANDGFGLVMHSKFDNAEFSNLDLEKFRYCVIKNSAAHEWLSKIFLRDFGVSKLVTLPSESFDYLINAYIRGACEGFALSKDDWIENNHRFPEDAMVFHFAAPPAIEGVQTRDLHSVIFRKVKNGDIHDLHNRQICSVFGSQAHKWLEGLAADTSRYLQITWLGRSSISDLKTGYRSQLCWGVVMPKAEAKALRRSMPNPENHYILVEDPTKHSDYSPLQLTTTQTALPFTNTTSSIIVPFLS